jgi:hypothetical protein
VEKVHSFWKGETTYYGPKSESGARLRQQQLARQGRTLVARDFQSLAIVFMLFLRPESGRSEICRQSPHV